MSDIEIANIPFDQYQRYSIVVDIINECSCHEKVRVLEVGANAHGNLKKFLPNATIVSLDTEASDELLSDENFYLGSGASLPFDDNSFDYVVSLDVLEHVPINDREAFIKESFRVASEGSIVAFPKGGSKTSSAEKSVNNIWREYFGEDYRWLKEHFENGLPVNKDISNIVDNIRANSYMFSHGSLANWVPLMKLHFLEQKNSDLSGLVQCFDRFYNLDICGSDIGEDNYRYFLVLMRQQENIVKAKEIYNVLNHGGVNYSFTSLANEVASVSESYVMLNDQLAMLNDQLAMLKNQSKEKDLNIELITHKLKNVENNLAEILSSSSWKITNPLRKLKKYIKEIVGD